MIRNKTQHWTAILAAMTFAIVTLWTGAAFADTGGGAGKSMFSALTDSGFIGFVIVLCSVVGVSLAITFAFQIRRDVLVPPDLIDQVQALFDDEDYEEALAVSEQNPCFLSAVVSSGLERMDEGWESMNDGMIEAGEIEATRLHQKVGYLSMIANIAPMLGLLGTVTGMIITFNKIATSPVQPKPKDLAGGISVALGTTFLGLAIAIPMTIIFIFFRNRVVSVVAEVGQITDEMMSRFKS